MKEPDTHVPIDEPEPDPPPVKEPGIEVPKIEPPDQDRPPITEPDPAVLHEAWAARFR